MALLIPDLSTIKLLSPGQYRERDVLQILADELPADFTIYHGVSWSSVINSSQKFGEFDAVVLAPSGHIVLIEIKAGDVQFSETEATKQYGVKVKDVARQCRVQLAALRSRLKQDCLESVRVGHLLVLPDQVVGQGTVAFPRERIVDATDMPEIGRHVIQAIPATGSESVELSRIQNFLENRFDLVSDAAAHAGIVNRAVISLSDGLAKWVPRIHHSAGIYSIQATAGSGKTQLALKLLTDAVHQGQRCLYVCFNRPLADHLVKVAPSRAQILTFHELCIEHARRSGKEPDFTTGHSFSAAVEMYLADQDNAITDLDLLIVDEAQDFEPTWVEALTGRVKHQGRLYVMGDADQSIYPRDEIEMQEATTITCHENFRSPREIVLTINALALTAKQIAPRCPIEGRLPGFHCFGPNDTGGVKRVEAVVKALLAEGYPAEHIALITFAGRERSKVLAMESISGISLRKFTGAYDQAGNAMWSHGALLCETLYRFKGQAMPVVILCEVDFETFDNQARSKLFVGMTRAQQRLEIVMSQRVEELIAERLQ